MDQSIVIAAMMSDLLKNNVKKLLIKTYPQDLSDMLVCAEKYARMEETLADDTHIDLAATEPSKERHPRWEEKRCQHLQSPPLR